MPSNIPQPPRAQGSATESEHRLAALADLFAKLSTFVDTTDSAMVAARQRCREAIERRLLDEEGVQ